ncbi:MAG: RNA polymerase sigma factor [Planctomycetota bacterium]
MSVSDQSLPERDLDRPRQNLRLVDGHAGTGSEAGRPSPELQEISDSADPALCRDRDASLVGRVKTGDMDAFTELLDAYQGRVYRMITRMLSRNRETAEDLTQEVFLRVFRGIPEFQGDSSFSTWIYRITTNVCISELRARKAMKRDKPTLSLDAPIGGAGEEGSLRMNPESPAPDPAVQVERAELFEACRRAIEALPTLWRVILTLRDLEGRSYEEISEVLELPIGTVRSRLHRARSKVRTLLEGGAR